VANKVLSLHSEAPVSQECSFELRMDAGDVVSPAWDLGDIDPNLKKKIILKSLRLVILTC